MSEINTREEYHKTKGKKVYGQEDCPFCDKENNKERIIWEGQYWYLIFNKYPYSGQNNHLMAVTQRHIKFSYELTSEETAELAEVYKRVKEFYGEQIYFSATRESMANRSVEHLHIHFLPGRLQGKYIRNMLMNQGFPIIQHLDN